MCEWTWQVYQNGKAIYDVENCKKQKQKTDDADQLVCYWFNVNTGMCFECYTLVLGTIRLWSMTKKKNSYVEWDGICNGNNWRLRSCCVANNHPGVTL